MVRLTVKLRKVPIRMFTVPVGAISGIFPRRYPPSTSRRSTRPAPRTRNSIPAPIASPHNSDSDSNTDSSSSGDTVITPDALPDSTNSGKGSKAQSQTRITPITLSSDNSISDSDSQSESESESESLETAPAPPPVNSTEQREAGIAVQSVGEKRKRTSEENSEQLQELQERNEVQIQLARMEKRQIQMSSDIVQMKDTLNSIVSLLLDQPPSVKTNP